MKLKRFEEINEELNINKDFDGQKEEILWKLQDFMNQYEVFTLAVSPKNYRTTGHHFTELRKMQEDIKEFTYILQKERENEYIKDDLEKTENSLRKRGLIKN